ncbi:RNA pseudouridine synthase [bacterium]|nr:RNA pseudouridine synthase [bacterium]
MENNPKEENIKVLYEDNHLIAVYKPAGTLVQGDKSGDISMIEEVKMYIKNKYNKPGNVFLGLIHRLDRNVDGIVLFAKTSKGASRLSEQFREHSVEKIYHAWVSGIVKEKNKTLINFLRHNENQNYTEVFDEEVRDSDRAELSYEFIESDGDFSLLKIKLKTGRQHQIRSQLSHIGHPIVGDTKYGSTIKSGDQRIFLTETSLSFNTATTDERKTVTIEIPKKTW